MEKTLILQNPHWTGQLYQGLHQRDLMANLLQKKDLPHIQILTGVRRAGKSTIFKLLMNDLLSAGVSPHAILNLNLDAPMYIPFWDNASSILDIVERAETLTGEKVQYLFLDEIQQVKDWEIFVKNIYDSQVFRKIYITGSNSNMLQSRFASLLSGRYFENKVRPLSVSEYLGCRGIHTLLEAYQSMPTVLRTVSAMIQMGSFPEIALSDLPEEIQGELLHSYFESIVQKDCIVYHSIRDTGLFYKTTNYLLQNIGRSFSPRQLGKALNSNENTMTSYMQYLCDSHICTDIRNFSFSFKETKRSDHKFYCVDNGIMRANTFRFSPDSGSFFENLVFNELLHQGYENISFCNSNGECDFVASKNGGIHGFQVCYELTDQNRERALNGFHVSDVVLDSKNLITYNQKEQVGDVSVLPLWEWALSGTK